MTRPSVRQAEEVSERIIDSRDAAAAAEAELERLEARRRAAETERSQLLDEAALQRVAADQVAAAAAAGRAVPPPRRGCHSPRGCCIQLAVQSGHLSEAGGCWGRRDGWRGRLLG